MTTTTGPDPAVPVGDLKRQHRATWAAGDYAAVAVHIAAVGQRIARRVGVSPGDRVLDVACGTGNAAIPAAQAGGEVTGVDLTPQLLEAARTLAADAGVTVDWREGDAEALPFDDASFDVVLSTFGCMFAPRHRLAAGEIARVLRPGGRIGLCSWTPEGAIGSFFAVMGRHLPPPPPFASPPPRWGDPDHVRGLFDGSGIALDFDREVVELHFESVAAVLDFYKTNFGPIVKARELLEPQGGWLPLREELAGYFARATIPSAGGVVWPAEYLAVTGTKR